MATRKEILHKAVHGYSVPADYLLDKNQLEQLIQRKKLSCACIYALFQEILQDLGEEIKEEYDRKYYNSEVVSKSLSNIFHVPINDNYNIFLHQNLPQFMETYDNVKYTFSSLWDALHEISYTHEQIGIFWAAYICLIKI